LFIHHLYFFLSKKEKPVAPKRRHAERRNQLTATSWLPRQSPPRTQPTTTEQEQCVAAPVSNMSLRAAPTSDGIFVAYYTELNCSATLPGDIISLAFAQSTKGKCVMFYDLQANTSVYYSINLNNDGTIDFAFNCQVRRMRQREVSTHDRIMKDNC
jgi:hypothetical protein